MMFLKASILFSQLLVLAYSSLGFSDEMQMSLRNRNSNEESRLLGTDTLQYIDQRSVVDIVKNPAAAGSLKNCQGRCSSSKFCEYGLKCFYRLKNETVPGCTGDKPEFKGVAFCYKPDTYYPSLGKLKIVGDNGEHDFPFCACPAGL
jgi:hypothetical protein